MPTRRNLLLGFGNAMFGGALASSGAINAFAEPTADLRVLAKTKFPGEITLKPGREDEAYVTTNQDGYVTEIILNGQAVGSEGLNQSAKTHFEQLVTLCNEPPGPVIEELYFEFEVTDDGLAATDPTPAEIETALFIASAGGNIPGNGTVDFLAATDHGQTGADKIPPNKELPFGIGVDLLPSSSIQYLPDSETFSVALNITAKTKS